MIQLRLESGRGAPRTWVAVLLIGVGIVVVLSGLALLLTIGAAAAVIGGGVMLFRRLTGRVLPRSHRAQVRDTLELEPDFEILPATPSVNEEGIQTLPAPRNQGQAPRS